MLNIQHYVSPEGKDMFQAWLDKLRDVHAQARIYARIDRIALGNFGDSKSLRGGVHELRIDIGPGYRLYYALQGKRVVLLLCGGDKRTQPKDIERALAYWQDYQARHFVKDLL